MGTYTKTSRTAANKTRAGSSASWSLAAGLYWSSGTINAGAYIDWLCYSNFGFSIPSTESITGIFVTYTTQGQPDANATGCDGSIMLTTNATSPTGGCVDHATTTAYSNLSLTAQTRGSSSDNWGAGLTYSDVNSANFGLLISPKFNTGSSFIDFLAGLAPNISITITTTTTPDFIPGSSTMYQAGIMPVNGSRSF